MEMAFSIHPITLHVNYKNSNLALQLLFARDNVIKPENTCKVAPMGTQTIKPQGLFKRGDHPKKSMGNSNALVDEVELQAQTNIIQPGGPPITTKILHQ